MCFSFEISIGTFLVSWTISLYLLNKNLTMKQKHNIIFLMIFSTIQLADAILWYIKMEKNIINYYVTSYIIPIILSLQIIYNIYVRNKINNIYVNLFIIISIIYIFIKFNGYSTSVCDNKFSSPVWGSYEIKLWQLFLFAFIICYPNWKLLWKLILGIIFIKFISNGGYGSLWCAVANIIAIKYLFTYG